MYRLMAGIMQLTIGTRQRNIDYVLHWILVYLNGVTWILVMYDVMCQYFTNLYHRFRDSPALSLPESLTFM